MIKKTYHITKTDKGWQAKAEGSQRASFTATTKDEVKQQTIASAKSQGSTSVVIHKKDGRIQVERTYPRSADPTKSPG